MRHDMTLPLAMIGILQVCPASASEDVSAVLRARTQAFSDAGQQGDAALIVKLVGKDVIFFNENGESASRQDLIDSAQATKSQAAGAPVMTVTDWTCQVHGQVAVTSFIDDQVKDIHGQTFHAQYRSVETWSRETGDWQMIASQTLALQTDPPAITLDARTLDGYAGTYEAAPDLKVTFARSGNALMASVNGGPAVAQRAELRDVFFTPGQPRLRKIFQRDAQGGITGFVSRREGHDIIFKRSAQG